MKTSGTNDVTFRPLVFSIRENYLVLRDQCTIINGSDWERGRVWSDSRGGGNSSLGAEPVLRMEQVKMTVAESKKEATRKPS
jgi:hypothetical protein